MPKDTSKTLYTTSMNAELIQRFRVYCTTNGKYQNEVLEQLIEAFLNNQGGEINSNQNDKSFVIQIKKELLEVREILNNMLKDKSYLSNNSNVKESNAEGVQDITNKSIIDSKNIIEDENKSGDGLSEKERLNIENMLNESINQF